MATTRKEATGKNGYGHRAYAIPSRPPVCVDYLAYLDRDCTGGGLGVYADILGATDANDFTH